MNTELKVAAQRTLIDRLASDFRANGVPVELFETHISWVLVAGEHAYKFKKALRFDFLDFSSLALRRYYCHEELRLNRRLAPRLYLDVLAVVGTPASPVLGPAGAAAADVLDYAVAMRAFGQDALWSNRLQQRTLAPPEVDSIAIDVARFHREAERAPAESGWCLPPAIEAIARDNIDALLATAATASERALLAALRDWDSRRRRELEAAFLARRASGAVRDCHGDLHAGNIATVDGVPQAFDCIEFNPGMRWNDVISDAAFLSMDLAVRRRPRLAARFINRYLEESGDYPGLTLLRYYQVQRALVRAKVESLRAAQGTQVSARRVGPDDAGGSARASYLAYAAAAIDPPAPVMMLTRGVSGCGKSTLARRLVELLGAVQIRSDVERRRLPGAESIARMPGEPRYSAQARARTYRRLLELAECVLRSGLPVVVDAAFLAAGERMPFFRLAERLGVRWVVFDLHAEADVLRERVDARQRSASDASEAGSTVLEAQLASYRPLEMDELPHALRVDTSGGIDAESALAALATPVLDALVARQREDAGA